MVHTFAGAIPIEGVNGRHNAEHRTHAGASRGDIGDPLRDGRRSFAEQHFEGVGDFRGVETPDLELRTHLLGLPFEELRERAEGSLNLFDPCILADAQRPSKVCCEVGRVVGEREERGSQDCVHRVADEADGLRRDAR